MSKFTSKWDGPYVVQEVYTNGAYKIISKDRLRIELISKEFYQMAPIDLRELKIQL